MPKRKVQGLQMQVTRAEALCQEFCEEVSVSVRVLEDENGGCKEDFEIKCRLDRKFFSELLSRMVELNYCCGQVQQDIGANKCVAWFEEVRHES